MSANNQTITPHSPAKSKGTTDKASSKALGRGVDVGTATLLSASQDESGRARVKSERNSFLELPAQSTVKKGMLTKLGVPYVKWEDRMFVLGDASFELANLLGHDVRRPMCDGFLAPGEKEAIPMMRFMLERLLGKPSIPGEPAWFCIPAPSIDRDNDTVYHEGIVGGIIEKLGFTPHSINEAHAIAYSELAEEDFTGITVSCGGGMFNVCVTYRTIPTVMFSISRGGDWIDQHVAKVMGMTTARATAIKEDTADLMNPKTREEEAVALYYRSLVGYMLENLQKRFELARDVPQFTKPVSMVVAGGTSLANGFVEMFNEELAKADLSIPIASVRRAEDAFTSVVRGCLVAAALSSEDEDDD